MLDDCQFCCEDLPNNKSTLTEISNLIFKMLFQEQWKTKSIIMSDGQKYENWCRERANNITQAISDKLK